ncbi:hypothetical protein [Streptomyces sp. NBC_00582]|uniref:hypothetical protein n=1 Tax=Streptomyces sp. NBC_00582 TaxID=2975783 RepID=UPI002E8079B9|nr:hypothetical protein [Streptomyces sp. NBC_00582]WUB67460.1 hypothetical protein OG852_47245 [Streptomyces sp. NBC_00582]
MTETAPTLGADLTKSPSNAGIRDIDQASDAAFLTARGVSKPLHGRAVLKHPDFRVSSGEIAVLISKSGLARAPS